MIKIILLILGLIFITLWYLFYSDIFHDDLIISEINSSDQGSLKSFDLSILKTENIDTSMPSLESINNSSISKTEYSPTHYTDYTTNISEELTEKSFDVNLI